MANKAGKEFCDCLKKEAAAARDTALNRCHEMIAVKYPLLKIYQETRDTDINKLYEPEKVKTVLEFAARFANAVDECDPAYWSNH